MIKIKISNLKKEYFSYESFANYEIELRKI